MESRPAPAATHRGDLSDAPVDLVVHRTGGSADRQRVSLFGEVDAVNTGRLHREVAEVLADRRPSAVEIDLRGVTFLDSAGIRALLICRQEAARQGCALTLADPQPAVHQVLRITGLLQHFGLAEATPADRPRAAG
jgi:anti-anti-sigma factor